MSIQVVPVTGGADLKRLFRFLYELWYGEFGRSMGGMNHQDQVLQDDLDPTAIHMAALDEQGRIVGCIRTNFLLGRHVDSELGRRLHLDRLLDIFEAEEVSFTSRLAVSPHVRGRTVASQLTSAVVRKLVRNRIKVDLSYCQLNLVHMYYQLGSRPYAPNFRLEGAGVRVPLAYCALDREYLKAVGSPFVPLVPEEVDDGGEAAQKLRAFSEFEDPQFHPAGVKALWARLAHSGPQDGGALLDGLGEEAIQVLRGRAARVVFKEDEQVYRQGDSEPGMGIVVSGGLGVSVGEGASQRYVAVIGPGEPFGEMQTLGLKGRTADVVALEDTEALLLSPKLIEELSREKPELGMHLASNLLKILAKRLARTDKLLSREESDAAPRIRRPAAMDADIFEETCESIESYLYDSFDDPEQELERLTQQASVAEALEFEVLERAGLSDGQKILDLGSGPGVISTLFARRYPDSRVFGVEPDATLLENARRFAAERSFGDRCTFLEGTAQEIPLDDDSIDFAYARLLFQHLPDCPAAAREMARVTRPDGVVTILDADDGSIIMHPEVPGWDRLQTLAMEAQAGYGGDRHIGRKLYGLLVDAGLEQVRVSPLTITSVDLGPEAFFNIVFGFKRQLLLRIGAWDDEARLVFDQVLKSLSQPGGFASTTAFIAHGVVPVSS